MAEEKKEKEKKGKRVRKGRKHEKTHVYKYFDAKGGSILRKKKSCPRCGAGTWLAEHKDRAYCGKCGYTEFEKRPAENRPAPLPTQQPAQAGKK